jgi:hypothetical protein
MLTRRSTSAAREGLLAGAGAVTGYSLAPRKTNWSRGQVWESGWPEIRFACLSLCAEARDARVAVRGESAADRSGATVWSVLGCGAKCAS